MILLFRLIRTITLHLMRIFRLTVFLGLCTLCVVLDFLFLETDYNITLAAFPVAAAIIGGASLLGGLGNVLSNSAANETNKEIAKENRDWQSVENEKSRKYSSEMWEKENLYNTPSAQMQRYSEAGLNPYLVNGQGASSGNAGSANQPSQQGAPNGVEVKPNDFGFIGRASNDFLSAYNESRSVDANTANQSAQRDKTIIDNTKELYRVTGDWKTAQNYLNSNLKSSRGVNSDTTPVVRQIESEVVASEANAKIKSVEAQISEKYGEKQAANIIALQEQEFNKSAAQIRLMASEGKVNDAKIKTLASEYCRNVADAYKLRKEGDHYVADTQTINQIREFLVAKQRMSAQMMSFQYTEAQAFFEQGRARREYMMHDPEAQENELTNYQTGQDTFYTEVSRIMSSWNVQTSVSGGYHFNGGHQSKTVDVYGY